MSSARTGSPRCGRRNPPRWRIQRADCLNVLPRLDAGSVEAIVTDPPYGLEFMGADWDRLDVRQPDDETFHRSGAGPFDRAKVRHSGAPSYGGGAGAAMQAWHERWAREALRVIKPGGFLLAFGGTRTFHRLACALEDAGFEIRDTLCWLYGQGFPKSLNVAVAIDKLEGCPPRGCAIPVASTHLSTGRYATEKLTANPVDSYQACSRRARAWQGWGTALKPGWEPIILARKPLTGTVAANVLTHGTGAINVDGCRIAFCCPADEQESKHKNRHGEFFASAPRKNIVYGADAREQGNYDAPGRWPANVALSHTGRCRQTGAARIRSDGHHPARRGAGRLGTAGHKGQHSLAERSSEGEHVERWECPADCPVRMLDEQSGAVGNGWSRDYGQRYAREGRQYRGGSFGGGGYAPNSTYADVGGASRFFYCAKSSTAEREAGVTHGATPRANTHPTVKPIELMRWLVRLITPPGGLVLDPFAGSGSTGIAALLEGARFVGVEQNREYANIARARIRHWAPRAAERRMPKRTNRRGPARVGGDQRRRA